MRKVTNGEQKDNQSSVADTEMNEIPGSFAKDVKAVIIKVFQQWLRILLTKILKSCKTHPKNRIKWEIIEMKKTQWPK